MQEEKTYTKLKRGKKDVSQPGLHVDRLKHLGHNQNICPRLNDEKLIRARNRLHLDITSKVFQVKGSTIKTQKVTTQKKERRLEITWKERKS